MAAMELSELSFEEDQAYYEVASRLRSAFGNARYLGACLGLAVALLPAGGLFVFDLTSGRRSGSEFLSGLAMLLLCAGAAVGFAAGQAAARLWVRWRYEAWLKASLARRRLDGEAWAHVSPFLDRLKAQFDAGATPPEEEG